MPSTTTALQRTAFLLLLCMPVLTLAAGKTYRWKDAQGRHHYSDVRAAKSERIDIKTASGNTVSKEEQASRESREQVCRRKREQLETYKTANSVTETDSLGNIKTYSDEDKAKLVSRTQDEVRQSCGQKS